MAKIQDICKARQGQKPRSVVTIHGDIARIRLKCGNVARIPAKLSKKAELVAWTYHGSRDNNYYVKASCWIGDNKKMTFFLHHLVKPLRKTTPVDHIDGDTLNNLPANLRYVTRRQNGLNGKPRKRPGSEAAPVGVTYDKSQERWRVRVSVAVGKSRHVGWYKDKDEAIEVARLTHLNAHKEFSSYQRGTK